MRERPRTAYLLNQTNLAVRSQVEARLRDLQMTGIQYTVLSMIEAREGLSSAELSRRFFVTAQTMNEIINGLVQRKLIARRQDSDNRRILRLRPTAQGRRLLAQCDAIVDEVEVDAFGWMSAESYAELRKVLSKLLSGQRQQQRKLEGDDS